jgi:hypothetical protein
LEEMRNKLEDLQEVEAKKPPVNPVKTILTPEQIENNRIKAEKNTKVSNIQGKTFSGFNTKPVEMPQLDTNKIASNIDNNESENKKSKYLEEITAVNELIQANNQLSGSYELIKNAYGGVAAGALSIAGAMVESSVQGGASIKELGSVVADTARQIIAAEISKGIAASISNTLLKSGVPFPFNIALAGMAGAAAVGLFNAVIPKFADGAVVNGATYAMIGEAGPETVLNKMQLGNLVTDLIGNKSQQVVVLETKIKGSDLILVQDNVNKRKTYSN